MKRTRRLSSTEVRKRAASLPRGVPNFVAGQLRLRASAVRDEALRAANIADEIELQLVQGKGRAKSVLTSATQWLMRWSTKECMPSTVTIFLSRFSSLQRISTLSSQKARTNDGRKSWQQMACLHLRRRNCDRYANIQQSGRCARVGTTYETSASSGNRRRRRGEKGPGVAANFFGAPS